MSSGMHKTRESLIEAYGQYTSFSTDREHRYNSWQLCYEFFRDHASTERLEESALHLMAYLSSWGMYRGSSKLLTDYNYLVHRDAVKIILDGRSDLLDARNLPHTGALMKLKSELTGYYAGKSISATDTLVTKILLGTTGSVPAYDRYFRAGAKLLNIRQAFAEKSVSQLTELWNQFADEFADLSDNAPPMKVLDCALWQMGFNDLNPTVR